MRASPVLRRVEIYPRFNRTFCGLHRYSCTTIVGSFERVETAPMVRQVLGKKEMNVDCVAVLGRNEGRISEGCAPAALNKISPDRANDPPAFQIG